MQKRKKTREPLLALVAVLRCAESAERYTQYKNTCQKTLKWHYLLARKMDREKKGQSTRWFDIKPENG